MFDLTSNKVVPVEITTCPIKDVVAEIRYIYNDGIVSEVFSGILFNELEKNSYNCSFHRMPINDTPLAIRESNVSLKYQAHYVINIGELSVRISLGGVAIAINGVYKGWEWYSNDVSKILNIISGLNLVYSIDRFGLRYSSFFEEDLFDKDKINICVSIADNNLINAKNYIRTEWVDNNIGYILQLSNNVILNVDNIPNKSGSLIDIDISTTLDLDISKCITLLSKFHEQEKIIFFNILKLDFLNSLGPRYNDE